MVVFLMFHKSISVLVNSMFHSSRIFSCRDLLLLLYLLFNSSLFFFSFSLSGFYFDHEFCHTRKPHNDASTHKRVFNFIEFKYHYIIIILNVSRACCRWGKQQTILTKFSLTHFCLKESARHLSHSS